MATYVEDDTLSIVTLFVAHGNSARNAGKRVALQEAAEMVVNTVRQFVVPGALHSA